MTIIASGKNIYMENFNCLIPNSSYELLATSYTVVYSLPKCKRLLCSAVKGLHLKG